MHANESSTPVPESVDRNADAPETLTLDQVAARSGMTVDQLTALSPEELEAVAGGDFLDTLIEQYKDIKRGINSGWHEPIGGDGTCYM